MTLEETYDTINTHIKMVTNEINDIQNLINNNDSKIFCNPAKVETTQLVINDALLQVDTFTIEQCLQQLDLRKNQFKQSIDEDIWLKGRVTMLAASDLRVSLRESGYIQEEALLGEIDTVADKNMAQQAIEVIKNEFTKEMQTWINLKKEINSETN